MSLTIIAGLVGIVFIGILVIGLIMTKMFHRASKEQSFVRTGFGGQKVVKDGGAVVLPVFHETISINMQTLRLGVERRAKESLITRDRLRVDVKAEFYVRVAPDEVSIASAAQTLGRRTLNPVELSALIEGKFIDALRAAAAGMDMQDLHEKRGEFVQKVQTTVAEDLKKNGLELESVSLTGLDQTSIEHFNPSNAFDAEGLAKLTKVTETRRQERNQIEADTRVAIETKNLEANSKSLDLARETELATLEQERQIQTARAEQEANLAKQRAEREREAETARIEATQATETARVSAAQATEQARVAKERAVQVSETEAAQALELAAQASRIAVAAQSQVESEARASADTARALAVKASENVKTVEAEAQAERAKRVAIIQAEQDAEQEAAGIRIRADAELSAADKQAQAKERLIEAEAKRYEVEAEGQRSLNEAGNVTSASSMAFALRKSLIERMPEIIERMTKPIEKVGSIRVVQMQGMGGQNGQSADGVSQTPGQTGNLPTDLTNSLLNYRLQVPVIDAMAAELGLDMTRGLNGMVESLSTPLITGEDGSAAIAPVTRPAKAPRLSTAQEKREAEAERQELQRLAGIQPGE